MIKSVAKAIEIMNTFSPDEPRLTLREIAHRLDQPKSTVHNLLATLVHYGFVEKLEDDSYALGTAIIALGQSARVNVELRDRAAPLLRQLADSCRESVYLTVLDGDESLYIYALESPRRLLARTAVGDRVNLHCTSVGKAMLAAMPQEQVEEIVTRRGFISFTPNTITDLDTLLADLQETRLRGFAIDDAEHEVGTYCIGAPILNHRGQVIGACSLSGPDPEIVAGRLQELSRQVTDTAMEISRRMGYVPARISSLGTISPQTGVHEAR